MHQGADRTTGAGFIASQLRGAGISTIFGVMGDGNVDFIGAAVQQYGLRYIAARHEQGSVSMAEGFARATGEIGLATVTYGPGLGNTVTAITSAVRHHAAILVVCGHRLGRHGPPQFHDPDEMLRTTGVHLMRIERPEEVPGSIARAVAHIRRAGEPVVLSYSDLILEGPWSPVANPAAAPADPEPAGPQADPAALDRVAAILAQARRPVILCGRGARDDDARAAAEALAERTGAALMTSLLGHGMFRDHPAALGISGGLASAAGRQAMARADAVLVLGAELNGWTCDGGRAFAEAVLVQADTDPQVFARAFRKAEVPVLSGARAFCEALAGRLPPRPASNAGWWRDTPALPEPLAMERNGRLDPVALARALDAALPADRGLALDGGHFFEALCREIRVSDERAFFWTLGFGSVGLGLATAIGAAVGRPERLTVAGVGDGGLMMSLPDLETVARYRLPLLVLVMNDASYGAEEKLLQNKGWNPDLARFPETDFAALGTALGIESAVLRTEADVRALLPRLAGLEAPFLIDARIDQSRNAEFIELLHRLKAVTG